MSQVIFALSMKKKTAVILSSTQTFYAQGEMNLMDKTHDQNFKI